MTRTSWPKLTASYSSLPTEKLEMTAGIVEVDLVENEHRVLAARSDAVIEDDHAGGARLLRHVGLLHERARCRA